MLTMGKYKVSPRTYKILKGIYEEIKDYQEHHSDVPIGHLLVETILQDIANHVFRVNKITCYKTWDFFRKEERCTKAM